MKHSPKSIANYFLAKAWESGSPLDPMKLQKLIYYANGWYAGQTGESLLNEPIEAWPYGPVIPSLYHEFKRFGGRSITAPATEFDASEFSYVPVPPPHDRRLCEYLDRIWDGYSVYSGVQLSEMTHSPGGPWDQTMKRHPGMRGVDIPLELIIEHFEKAIQKSQ